MTVMEAVKEVFTEDEQAYLIMAGIGDVVDHPKLGRGMKAKMEKFRELYTQGKTVMDVLVETATYEKVMSE